MADRDENPLPDITWWPHTRRPAAPSRQPNALPSRGVTPLRRRAAPRPADDALDATIEFTLEGGPSPGTLPGYNPYDNRPRAADTVPWKPRVR